MSRKRLLTLLLLTLLVFCTANINAFADSEFEVVEEEDITLFIGQEFYGSLWYYLSDGYAYADEDDWEGRTYGIVSVEPDPADVQHVSYGDQIPEPYNNALIIGLNAGECIAQRTPTDIYESSSTPTIYCKRYNVTVLPLRVDIIDGEAVLSREGDWSGDRTGEFVIPDTINGYPVTRIGDYAFADSNFTSIIIPDSVKSIGDNAFEDCKSLESVVMPDSVAEIGRSAFRYCRSLENIVIPDGITSIGDRAFSYCRSLESIVIPDSVKEIGAEAFSYCSSLETVTIGNGLETAGTVIFNSCRNLRTVNYNAVHCDFVDNNWRNNFGWVGVETVNIGSEVEYIPEKAFADCRITSIDIPDNVTEICREAFGSCYSLETVTIGKGLTTIGETIFGGCYNCKTVNYNAVRCAIYNDNSNNFGWNNSVETVNIGSEVEYIPKRAFSECKITSIDIPDNVTEIGDNAFGSCYLLETATIGKGLMRVGETIFRDCYNLITVNYNAVRCDFIDNNFWNNFGWNDGVETLNISSEVGYIPKRAFSGCKITSIDIPDNVTEICNEAFNDCQSLETVTIGKGLEVAGAVIFNGCNIKTFNYNAIHCEINAEDYYRNTNIGRNFSDGFGLCNNSLENIIIGDEVEYIPEAAFIDCYEVESLVIPDSVTEINDGAFAMCGSLENVYGGNGIRRIGAGAFWECESLIEPLLPESLEEIGDGAFANCFVIEEVVIPQSVRYIGCWAFMNCSSLRSVYFNALDCEAPGDYYRPIFQGCQNLIEASIGEDVTHLPEYLFRNVNSLTKVYFPTTLTSIGAHAFDMCRGLTEIDLSENRIERIDEGAFSGCTNVKNIYLPETVWGIGDKAFYQCFALERITIPGSVEEIGRKILPKETVILGYDGTAAREYALSNGNTFISIDEGSIVTESTATRIENKIVVKSTLSRDLNGMLMHIGIFARNGALLDYSVLPSETPTENVYAVFGDIADASYVKILIWDSLKNMNPVSAAETVEIHQY